MLLSVIMKHALKLIVIFIALSSFFSSNAFSKNTADKIQDSPKIEKVFDKNKWIIKQGKDYPHRNAMLNDIVYTDKFRNLNKSELLEALGEPSYYREDKNYLHYIITQTRLASWPLHTKVLVIKLTDDHSVEWIKIHK